MRNQDGNSEKLGKNQKETKTKPKETSKNKGKLCLTGRNQDYTRETIRETRRNQ